MREVNIRIFGTRGACTCVQAGPGGTRSRRREGHRGPGREGWGTVGEVENVRMRTMEDVKTIDNIRML